MMYPYRLSAVRFSDCLVRTALKTTLIRTVVGLIKETKGTITVNGFPLKEQFTSAMKSIGAIIENPEFYDYLTGYQNLKHFANMHEGVTSERLMK